MANLPLLPPNIDEKKLTIAILLVVALGIFIMALQFVIPLLGILGAIGIIGAAAYGILVFLTKKP